MSELKNRLRLKLVSNRTAKRLLDRKHPLGMGQSVSFSIGIFWDGRLEGVMTFGSPISNVAVSCYDIKQWDCIELRKMWCSDVPARNSESRALAIAAKMIQKQYPHIQCLITYCDSDENAVAYRAAGWIPQKTHTYVREVLVDGEWLSVRDANRKRLTNRATDKRTESRRKWTLPFNALIAEKAKRLTTSQQTAAPARPERSIFT